MGFNVVVTDTPFTGAYAKPVRRGPSFATTVDPGTLYGAQSSDQVFEAGRWRVSRREAMAVPAVKRGRDIITRIGSLPLQQLDPDNQPVARSLFSQPQDGVSPVAFWTGVVDDLICYEAAWLVVTAVGWDGRAASVVKLDAASAAVPKVAKTYRTATGSGSAMVYDPDPYLIRIDSPTEPLLSAGARAIRALSRLELAALRAAEGVPPSDWFTPKPGETDLDDDDVLDLLDQWGKARQARATGYVPAAWDYAQSTVDASKAQLAEARQQGVLEVARLMGVDPEDLGVSTTSRTYFNAQDRRRERLDFTLGQYLSAIESRMSMNDITPAGHVARFDVSRLAAADDLTSAQTDALLITNQIQDRDEIRSRRGLAPLGPAQAATDDQEATQ